MKIFLVAAITMLLPGCSLFYGKNLDPEQLDAIARLAEIQKVSGCFRLGIEGSGGFISGETGGAMCMGTAEPLTVDQAAQLMNGISLNVVNK